MFCHHEWNCCHSILCYIWSITIRLNELSFSVLLLNASKSICLLCASLNCWFAYIRLLSSEVYISSVLFSRVQLNLSIAYNVYFKLYATTLLGLAVQILCCINYGQCVLNCMQSCFLNCLACTASELSSSWVTCWHWVESISVCD